MPPCFWSHCDKWPPQCSSKNLKEQLIYRYCDQSITLRSHTKTSTLTHRVNRITRVTLCPRSFSWRIYSSILIILIYIPLGGIFLYSFHRGHGVSWKFCYFSHLWRWTTTWEHSDDVDLVTFELVSLLFSSRNSFIIIIENNS